MSIFEKYNVDKSKLVNPFSWNSIKSFCNNLLSLKGKPTKIAMSLALGIFIGIFMPMGFQLIFIIPLTMFFNLNVIIASTATFITNPITVLPIYFAIIKTGEFITQIKISWGKIEHLIKHPDFGNFVNLGYESLVVFFTGSLILGLLTALIIYFTTLKMIQRNRLKSAHN